MSGGAAAAPALPAVVAVVGAGDTLRGEEVRHLRGQVVAAGDDFNADTFEANEDGVQRALQALATVPMLATRRWVHLAEVQRLAGAAGARLAAYLERPAAHAVLCLSAARLDMRTLLGRAVQRHARIFQVGPPSAAALPSWLGGWGRRHGAAMTPEAAAMLIALCGQEVGPLCRAAEKVAIYAHPAAPFDADHVAAAQAAVAPAHIFALGERVGQRDWAAASQLLAKLLDDGQPAVLVNNLLVRHLQQLLVARTADAGQRRGAGLAARLGVPPGVADRLARQAAGWAPAGLGRALGRALAADAALKSTAQPAAVVLGAMVWDLIALARSPGEGGGGGG